MILQSNVCNGSFESLVDYGVEVATKCLKENQIDKAEKVLLNLVRKNFRYVIILLVKSFSKLITRDFFENLLGDRKSIRLFL